MDALNNDVPTTAILRQYKAENERLKKEVGELKHKLNNKEQAIKAFKEWQARICERKYQYWLNQGLELANNPVNLKELNALRSFFGHYQSYAHWLKKLNNVYEQIQKYGDRLLKAHNNE